MADKPDPSAVVTHDRVQIIYDAMIEVRDDAEVHAIGDLWRFAEHTLRCAIANDPAAAATDPEEYVAIHPGPVTAADVQRAREARRADDLDHTDPVLPAMTIPDDGRVDAGWPGADGGRDG